MLIMSQNRKALLNLESVSELFLSSAYKACEGQVKVLASYPLAEDVTMELGTYESEERAIEVLGEIFNKYSEYIQTKGGILPTSNFYAQPFAYSPPKVYQMPEK